MNCPTNLEPAVIVGLSGFLPYGLLPVEFPFTVGSAINGTFGAACHYVDGTFVPEDAQSKCPAASPRTGAKFNFWHPELITLHFWIWYPSPAGIYSGMNPMASPFNNG